MKKLLQYQNLIFITIFSIFILIFFTYNSGNYLDPDLGWHIRVGEEIATNKDLPRVETMNYPILGEKYIDHEWLINLIIFLIYDNYTYLALQLFFVLIISITLYLLIYFITKKSHTSLFAISPLLTLGMFAITPHMGVRVQEISLLFIILLLIIINYYTKSKNFRILLFLPPLFFFWACLHGTFLIGLFLLFFWLAVKITEKVICKYKIFYFLNFSDQHSKKSIGLFSLIFIASIITTFLTPYRTQLYSLLHDYSDTYYMQHVVEWLPPWHFPVNYYSLLYTTLSFILLTLIIKVAIKKNIPDNQNNAYKIDLWYFGLAVGFFILAFKSKRHFPLFFIVSFPVLIDFIVYYFSFSKDELKKIIIHNKLFYLIHKYFKPTFIILFFALTINYYLKIYISPNPFYDKFYCQRYPCDAIEFIKNSRHKDKRIYNNYGWGGYITKVWPEKLIFIDGKQPIVQYENHSFLEEYYDFYEADKCESLLEKHNIELVLLKLFPDLKLNWFEKYIFGLKENLINNPKNELQEYLFDSTEWSIIYDDEISQIFIKNDY